MRHSLFVLFFLGFIFSSASQSEESIFCNQITKLNNLIQKNHFKPKPLNDNYSKELFAFFLDFLDDKKYYLTTNEVETLKKHELKLDDYIQNGECIFIEDFSTTLDKALIRAKNLYNGLRELNLDYSGKDSLPYYAQTSDKPYLTEQQLGEYYNKRIRYSTLYNIVESDTSYSSISKNFIKEEPTKKKVEIDKAICKIDEILLSENGVLGYTQNLFLNAMCMYQDPHTIFFSPSVKQDFENSLSTSYDGFGLYMSKNTSGELTVDYIVPGSSAFKNGKIEEGDIIKSLASNKDYLSLVCVSENDAFRFINAEEHSKVQFELKKKDGAIVFVKLSKSELSVNESLTTGYILGKDLKIGYIEINSFYTDFESPFGLGVANDVAKELYRLNGEGVSALILDLRFNGGGSLKEAADLSGMFIDRGELAIFKQFDGNTYKVKDFNRGTLFKKPLLIMVNGQSASASELFAAAMQDHGRAIIVGTTTHGKGTSQGILPLDEENPNLGYAKITMERFDRISEKGIQANGVTPDIIIPSLGDEFQSREKDLLFSLTSEHTETSATFKNNGLKHLKELQEKSKTRVAKEPFFEMVASTNTIIKENYIDKEGSTPLSVKAIYDENLAYTNIWKQLLDEDFQPVQNLSVSNYSELEDLLLFDSDKKETNQLIHAAIAEDPYIIESYTILNNLIKLSTK